MRYINKVPFAIHVINIEVWLESLWTFGKFRVRYWMEYLSFTFWSGCHYTAPLKIAHPPKLLHCWSIFGPIRKWSAFSRRKLPGKNDGKNGFKRISNTLGAVSKNFYLRVFMSVAGDTFFCLSSELLSQFAQHWAWVEAWKQGFQGIQSKTCIGFFEHVVGRYFQNCKRWFHSLYMEV